MIRYMMNLLRRLFTRRLKPTTKAEREAVAARAREWRMLVGSLGIFFVFWLPLIVIALVHVLRGGWMPTVMS